MDVDRQKILTEWLELINESDKLVCKLEYMDETSVSFKFYKEELETISVQIAGLENAYPWIVQIVSILDAE